MSTKGAPSPSKLRTAQTLVASIFAALICLLLPAVAAEGGKVDVSSIPFPLFFKNKDGAFRDPAAIYHNGWFYLYFTIVKKDPDKTNYLYTAWSKSQDLVQWTTPTIFTVRDPKLNYSSPGNIIRFKNEWILCLQTYPTPHGEKFADKSARVFIARSTDLEHWSTPELLRVKGPDVAEHEMGRMIDPFLIEDKDESGKWWCFFKQKGVSRAWSKDLKTWHFSGNVSAGENPCVIVDHNEYVLFHSPRTGIGIKRSKDLENWRDEGVQMLGAAEWPWAKDRRLTAGFVLDVRQDPKVGKALLFFHIDDAGLCIAWSDDLKHWSWPGQVTSKR